MEALVELGQMSPWQAGLGDIDFYKLRLGFVKFQLQVLPEAFSQGPLKLTCARNFIQIQTLN